MRIVVNSIYFKDSQPDYTSFIENLFGFLCGKHPESHFYFLINKENNHQYPAAANVTVIPVDYLVNSFVSLKIWSSIKLPLVLRKLNATVLIQPHAVSSISAKVPQIMFMPDLIWIQKPALLPTSIKLYHRLFGRKSIQKAAHIITFSKSSQLQLINQYPNATSKTTAIDCAISSVFQGLNYEQKQAVKDSYADGRNYFLFTGGNDPSKNLVGVLKAFSSFKRWQKSNMKLLVTGKRSYQKDDVITKLNSYRYKDDVVVLEDLSIEQMALITASAFTLIIPYLYEYVESTRYMLTAMQCGVPVIASNLASMKELGGDSCLYASPKEIDEIANQMKQLYKDEQLQVSLKAKGVHQAVAYNWEKTATKFWDILLKVI